MDLYLFIEAYTDVYSQEPTVERQCDFVRSPRQVEVLQNLYEKQWIARAHEQEEELYF